MGFEYHRQAKGQPFFMSLMELILLDRFLRERYCEVSSDRQSYIRCCLHKMQQVEKQLKNVCYSLVASRSL